MIPGVRWSAILLLASVVPALRAQVAPGQVESAEEAAAIQTIVRGLQDAWNRGDAIAFSAHYAEDGTFTNIVGMQAYGRPGFQKQHERIFTTIYKGSHNVLAPGRLHFVRPDVALLDVESSLSGVAHFPPGIQAGSDGALHTRLLMVLSKHAGAWQIDAFHNVAVIPLP